MTRLRVVRGVWGKAPCRKPTFQSSSVILFMVQTTTGDPKKLRGKSYVDTSDEEEEEDDNK